MPGPAPIYSSTPRPASFPALAGGGRTGSSRDYLSFGDNRLLLDLDDPAQADQLRSELRRLGENAQLLLEEALPGPQHAWVGGPDGRFITELMVPLVLRSVRGDSKTATSSPRPFPSFTSTDRVRLPGSDWLFAKLYCPRAFEDDLLVGPVAELCLQGNCNGRRQ